MFKSKTIQPVTKVVDAKAGRISAVVSDESEDRDGDIIRAAGWQLDHFVKHPVLLASHDYRHIRSQIGEWESMDIKGKRLVGTARYYIGQGNDEADWAFKLASMGKAAFSVGFIPLEYKERGNQDDDPWYRSYEFTKQELLEVSHVTIPSNRNALQLLVARGTRVDPVVEGVAKSLLEDETTSGVEVVELDFDEPASAEQAEAVLQAETIARMVEARVGPLITRETRWLLAELVKAVTERRGQVERPECLVLTDSDVDAIMKGVAGAFK